MGETTRQGFDRLPGDTRAERFREATRLLRFAATRSKAEAIVVRAAVTPEQQNTLLNDWQAITDKEER